MDCRTVEMPYKTIRLQSLQTFLRRVLMIARPAGPKLDLEVMSDYMKRDLGFLDGRDPRQESDFSR